MTTIILTIIGILLAAAAALMVIFYGGDAFNSGSIGAEANTYQNAGTNVIAASQLAAADNVVLTLGDTRYLSEAPALPDGTGGTLAGTSPNQIYTVPVVGDNADAVCARINVNLRNGLNDETTPAPAAAVPGVIMQCAGNTFTAQL